MINITRPIETVVGEAGGVLNHPIVEVKKLSRLRRIIPSSMGVKIGRASLTLQKHSPTLLFAGGVVGVVATTVLACRATLRIEEVLEDHQSKMEDAKKLYESKHEDYPEQDFKQDMTYLYIRSAVAITKLYGPAIIVGVASIGSLAGAHTILNRRNVAMTAAYTAVDKAFKEYRARVVEELGEDKDREFRYSSEVVEVNDPNDPSGQTKMNVKRVGPDGPSQFARFFDEYTKNWQPTPEYNHLFIHCQQNWANDMLRVRGHIFLNEVYDALGIERSRAGNVMGWRLDPESDNYVDFGVYTRDGNPKVRDFVNGREGSILLDFNVSPILDSLKDKKVQA